MALGFTELLLLAGLGLVGLVPAIWAAIDAALKPDPAWQAAGQSKLLWVLLPLALGLLCALAAPIVAATYALAIRPKVVAHVE